MKTSLRKEEDAPVQIVTRGRDGCVFTTSFRLRDPDGTHQASLTYFHKTRTFRLDAPEGAHPISLSNDDAWRVAFRGHLLPLWAVQKFMAAVDRLVKTEDEMTLFALPEVLKTAMRTLMESDVRGDFEEEEETSYGPA